MYMYMFCAEVCVKSWKGGGGCGSGEILEFKFIVNN